ncbi:MAG TPA: hypothetical protein VHM26_01340 [Chitinophagaceae bacterium]|jgi:hypothetical protein|nr:hypothetical protein [Chitinophagaceae bacterium]
MKNTFLFILLICVCECYAQDDGVMRMTKRYYRSDPFLSTFSDFVSHLLNDPTLKNTQFDKRTDSTRFYFEGDYSKHSPFNFKADSIHVVLSEREELSDTSGKLTPLYVYQLIAYAKPGEEGLSSIQKEFKLFKRRHYLNFETEKKHQISDSSKTEGEIMEFFPRRRSSFSAFRTAWISTSNNKNMFVLTLRFSIKDNWAYIPLPGRDPISIAGHFRMEPVFVDGDW